MALIKKLFSRKHSNDSIHSNGSNTSTKPSVYKPKILTVGDSGVGKSALIVRYIEDSFSPNFLTTIGIDFKIKYMALDDENETQCKLSIWDTAGQERFRNITNAYYRGADGIMLVYDVAEEASFLNVRYWLNQIERNSSFPPIIILVGNKCDLINERQVSYNRASQLAKDYKIQFFETSAKTARNVNQSFDALIQQIIEKQKSDFEAQKSVRQNKINQKKIKLHDGNGKLQKLKQKIKCSGCSK